MNSDSEGTFFIFFTLYAILAIIGISLYGIIVRPHVIKKIIALTIFGDSLNVIAILIGYQLNGVPPEVIGTYSSLHNLSTKSVDPLPQALVLTAIVIGLAITLFLIFVSFRAFTLYGTLDMRKIRELRG